MRSTPEILDPSGSEADSDEIRTYGRFHVASAKRRRVPQWVAKSAIVVAFLAYVAGFFYLAYGFGTWTSRFLEAHGIDPGAGALVCSILYLGSLIGVAVRRRIRDRRMRSRQEP